MSNMSITDGNSGGGSLTNSSANGYGYDSASNSRGKSKRGDELCECIPTDASSQLQLSPTATAL